MSRLSREVVVVVVVVVVELLICQVTTSTTTTHTHRPSTTTAVTSTTGPAGQVQGERRLWLCSELPTPGGKGLEGWVC